MENQPQENQPVPQEQPAAVAVAGPSQEAVQIDIESKAIELLTQGKRAFFVHDYQEAVTNLEESVKLLDQKFGIGADECADGYYYYGLALYNVMRADNSLLVNNPSGAQTEDEGDDEDDDEQGDEAKPEEAEEAVEEKSTVEEKPAGVVDQGDFEEDITHSPKADETAEEPAAAAPAADGGEMMEEEMDPNQPSTSSGVTDANRETNLEDENEEDDGGSNAEIAFEVLTMAREIYTRQVSYKNDVHLKLAEAAQKIGEILIDWENYDDALTQFGIALQIRVEKLSPDDRLIAETYFTSGLAFASKNLIPPAQEHITKAIVVIETRITNLQTQLNTNAALTEQDKLKICQEIEELQKLLPDMRFKLDDMQNLLKAVDLVQETAKTEFLEDQEIQEKARQNLNKPITNLTHLVKRKRDDDDDEGPIKKRMNEENNVVHTNGNGHHANGNSTNGNSTNGNHQIVDQAGDVSMVE